jgi:hypothetical protein
MVLGVLGLGTVYGGENKATGKVVETPYGRFKLEENSVLRQFHLAQKTTQYDPLMWRPTVGDELSLTFHVKQGKFGSTVVADSIKLLKAGPNTIAKLDSPQTLEVLTSGRSGVDTRLSNGLTLKFIRTAKTAYEPAGWIPVGGEKAKIEFTVERARSGFGVNFKIDKITRLDR